MDIAIIGGHGRVGLLTAAALTARGHSVRALVRRTDQRADVEAAGARALLVDLEAGDAEALATAIAETDAVVFTAGGGADGDAGRKRTVDLEGSLQSQAAAARVGVRRFVQVSAMGVDEPVAPDADPVWRAYVEAKRDADAALQASGLDWTIVRPGRLTDGPATGSVRVGARLPSGAVPRADVAAVLVAVLEAPSTIGARFELTSGGDPVADALAALPRPALR